MTPINPYNKEEIVDYSNRIIKYFKEVVSEKKSTGLDFIIKELQKAKDTICIASTEDINTEIIKSLYPIIDKNVRIYIIISSFDSCKKTVDQFGKTKPALIRQVSELKNNFILIDNDGFICTNSLAKNENHFIKLDDTHSKDLSYFFNYYFWNKASKEKKLDTIQEPLDSPYPNFNFSTQNIKKVNDLEEIENQFTQCIVPNDSKFKSQKKNIPFFISSEIDSPSYINYQSSYIGNFLISDYNLLTTIGNQWKFEEGPQALIQEQIIPFDSDDWKNPISIKDHANKEVNPITVIKIEDMNNAKPSTFPPVPYVNKVLYIWKVIPPYKPSSVSRAKLYRDYDNLEQEFKKKTDDLKRILHSIQNERNPFMKLFTGKLHTASVKLKQIEDWEKIALREMDYNKLNDFTNEVFPKFYSDCKKERSDLNLDIDKERQKDNWNTEKKDKENKKENIIKEISFLEEELQKTEGLRETKEKTEKAYEFLKNVDKKYKEFKNEDFAKFIKSLKNEVQEFLSKNSITSKDILTEKLKNLDKTKDKIHNELNKGKSIENLNRELKRKNQELEVVENELKQKYTNFVFKSGSEISQTQKKSAEEIVHLPCPKYPLPEVGELFEDSNKYYLEIENYEELDKANEIAKNRYKDKQQCLVVAKEKK